MARGNVLVTGASTGIGEATVRRLLELDFDVAAGVRKDEDADRLSAAGARPVKLDVTDQASIDAARARLGDAALAGLVNNAGIAVSFPLEFVPIEELRHQLEVNVIGQVAVTQAFLPALRKGRGRIVNVSSIGGRIALPLGGPYNASKFALEGLSDSLRRELRADGIEVSLIEPLPPLALADAERWCRCLRGTDASGNGLRRSAASASPVTQTGVCELPR